MIYRTNTGSRSLSGNRPANHYLDDFSLAGRQDGNHAWSGTNPMRFSGSRGRSWSLSGMWHQRVESGVSERAKVALLEEFAE